jgi:hypothetical protein
MQLLKVYNYLSCSGVHSVKGYKVSSCRLLQYAKITRSDELWVKNYEWKICRILTNFKLKRYRNHELRSGEQWLPGRTRCLSASYQHSDWHIPALYLTCNKLTVMPHHNRIKPQCCGLMWECCGRHVGILQVKYLSGYCMYISGILKTSSVLI